MTHWSSRLLGAELGLSNVTIAKVWKKWGLQPWRVETFKFSTDPGADAEVRDVVALYLNPPDKARCALQRREIRRSRRWTARRRSFRCDLGLPAKQRHDYEGNGTTAGLALSGGVGG